MTEPQPRGADDATPDLDAAARELLLVTSGLADTLERENELLRAPHLAGLTALYAEKAELANSYGKLHAALRADPEGLRRLAGERREALLNAAARLSRATETNERRLRAAGDATERVIGFIAEAVAAQRTAASYTGARKRALRPAATGVSLDKNF
jgi:hypothetical protein